MDKLTSRLAKKRSPSEQQISKHREQQNIHYQWKNDLGKIRGITDKLDDAYKNHKGDFALGRYEEIKNMIKGSIKEYHDLMDKTQKHNQDSAASAIANRYRSGGQTSYQSQQSPPPVETGKSGGFFSKIKQKAEQLTGTERRPSDSTTTVQPSKNDLKDQEMATWGYEGMNSKQVEEQTETMRKEVLQYKQDFRRERDRLDRLAKEYEDSKKHAPPQRYTELKYMIKDAVTRK